MDRDKLYNLNDSLKKLYKDCDCSMSEFGKYLIKFGMHMCDDASISPDNYTEEEMYKHINENDIKDLDNTFHNLMNMFIKYLHTHPNVLAEIEDAKKTESAKYKDLKLTPDIEFSLCADGLEESIKHGDWCCYTDACLSLTVGGQNIISRY